MPIISGKPGSIRYRGVIRAQMKVGKAKCQELLNYDLKQGLKNPPVVFLNPLNHASLQAAVTAFNALLNAKNT